MEARLTIKLPLELRQRARIMATARGMTVSEIVRAALEEFIAETESDDSADVREAVAAYERYKAHPDQARSYSEIRAELVAEGRLRA